MTGDKVMKMEEVRVVEEVGAVLLELVLELVVVLEPEVALE